MDRRRFLRNSALLAAGVVAADQLELLERLSHVRKFFPSGSLDNRFNAIFSMLVRGREVNAIEFEGRVYPVVQREQFQNGWERIVAHVHLAEGGRYRARYAFTLGKRPHELANVQLGRVQTERSLTYVSTEFR